MNSKKVFKGMINGKSYEDFREFQKDFASLQDFSNYSVSSYWETVEVPEEKETVCKAEKNSLSQEEKQKIYDFLTNRYLVVVSDQMKAAKQSNDINSFIRSFRQYICGNEDVMRTENWTPEGKKVVLDWLKAQIKALDNHLEEVSDKIDFYDSELDSITSEIEESREHFKDKAIACISGRWQESRHQYQAIDELEKEYNDTFNNWFENSLDQEISEICQEYFQELFDIVSSK